MQDGQLKGRHQAIIALRGAWWRKDRNVQRIFQILDGESGRSRVVGGIVRDTIIHGPSRGDGGMARDMDMASELLPEEVVARARRAGMSCYETGIAHGTVTVINGDIVAEVTTLRRDVKTDGRRALVEFGTDWEADARRRDFTINGLYAGMDGDLFDPLSALEDLFARRVRFIGDPDQRLREDRLRVFRFFRFTASHGDEICDPEGFAACRRFSGELDNLPAERVGAEMEKILALPKIAATLAAMTKASVLDLQVPCLETLAAYEDMTGIPTVTARLAILFNYTDMEALRKKWRLSNSMVNEARSIGETARMMIGGDLFGAAYRHGRLAWVALPVAAAIDGWDEGRHEEMKDFWNQIRVPSFPVNGDDLLQAGFRQGPELGKALRQIEREWINSGFRLDREQLLARLHRYLD